MAFCCVYSERDFNEILDIKQFFEADWVVKKCENCCHVRELKPGCCDFYLRTLINQAINHMDLPKDIEPVKESASLSCHYGKTCCYNGVQMALKLEWVRGGSFLHILLARSTPTLLQIIHSSLFGGSDCSIFYAQQPQQLSKIQRTPSWRYWNKSTP